MREWRRSHEYKYWNKLRKLKDVFIKTWSIFWIIFMSPVILVSLGLAPLTSMPSQKPDDPLVRK